MNRAFRKYHRQIAIVLSLPLFLTLLTGLSVTIFDEWLHQDEIAEFLLGIHTLKILHLEAIYPVLTALGLVGLLVTGLSMTSLFKKRPDSPDLSDRS